MQSDHVISPLKIFAQLSIYHSKIQGFYYYIYKAWPNLELTISLMSSPTTLLSFAVAMLAYLLFLQHPKYAPISEPLHSLFPLPGVTFSFLPLTWFCFSFRTLVITWHNYLHSPPIRMYTPLEQGYYLLSILIYVHHPEHYLTLISYFISSKMCFLEIFTSLNWGCIL